MQLQLLNTSCRFLWLSRGVALTLLSLCGFFAFVHDAASQGRDFRAERLVIDDDGTDGTLNTMTIQTGDSLGQNVVIIIPDMGSDSAEFLLLPYGSAGAWLLNGNAGTTPGTNYVGTSDSTALHLYVNGGASNAFILNTNGSIQHDNGGDARGANAIDFQSARTATNQVASGDYTVIGGGLSNLALGSKAVIGGGEENGAQGTLSTISGGGSNDIGSGSTGAVIGGGSSNFIRSNSTFATIGGGVDNNVWDNFQAPTIAGGEENSVQDSYTTVGGGRRNVMESETYASVIAGGFANRIYANAGYSTVGGGTNNYIRLEPYSTISGGQNNQILSDHGAIGGGDQNKIDSNAGYSAIGGGANNYIRLKPYSTISGGQNNQIGSNHAAIGGGSQNIIDTNAYLSTIGGGSQNVIDTNAYLSTIGGGQSNEILGDHGVIGGGQTNQVSSQYATIGGGRDNLIETGRHRATIAGGFQNQIITNGESGTIGGGRNNTVSNDRGTVGGGQGNTVGGIYSTVGGGRNNSVGSSGSYHTIAGGQNNQITGFNSNSAIGGGFNNTITKSSSAIPGGQGLTLNGAGSFGFLSNQFGSLNMGVSTDKVALFGNTDLWLANNDGAASRLLFYEANSDTGAFPTGTTYYTSLEAGDQSENITYTLPAAAPTSNDQVLSSDTNGVMSWEDPGVTSWSLTGNAGTTPGTNYVGTSDATALHLYANGGVSALILNTNGSIQHSTGGDARGASAIDLQYQRNGNDANVASGNYSTLSGGFANRASGAEATVGGGQSNAASGVHATVGGGLSNTSSGDYATVGGGRKNTINGTYSSIPGGANLTLAGGGSFGFLADSTFALPMTVAAGNTAVFGNTDLWLANNDGAASQLRFYEANSTTGAFPTGTTYYTSFEAGDQGEDITYTLPAAAPTTNGQFLSSDTNGVMSWGDASGTAWSLTGNAGTTAGTNYIGTSDATALHLYVNGGGSNAVILNTDGSIQHGTAGDVRGTNGVDLQIARTTTDQVASGDYSVIAGGFSNRASGTRSVVSGGESNSVGEGYGAIGGGVGNIIESGTIAGTIAGGNNNTIDSNASYSAVAGGYFNSVDSSASFGAIGGGQSNVIRSDHGVIAGGQSNEIQSDYGTIGGGRENLIETGRRRATIAGGFQNQIITIGESGTIGGGRNNTVAADRGTISGGHNNTVAAQYSTIGGGRDNSITGSGSYNTVAGGWNNQITGLLTSSTIAGGLDNAITKAVSAIPGGRGLTLNGVGSFGFLSNQFGALNMQVNTDHIALFGNTDLWLANNDGAASQLRFYEANSDTGSFPTATTYYTSFEAGDQSQDITYTLPAAAPTSNGQVLSSDTNGVMNWFNGPTGAQSFSNASNATSTLALENNVGTDDGIALEIVEGRVVLSNSQGAPTNIPDDMVAFEINDVTASSAPVVGLPASGTNGQILYILVSDPDGATVGGVARASGDKLTYLHLGGAWQLFHLN